LSLKLKNELSTSFFLLSFFENGLTTGQKLKRGRLRAINKKKMMGSIGRLSVGGVGLESTRGQLRANKKKKKMSPIGRLSVGTVGQELTSGQMRA
jgi:hypothetical protein